MNKKINKAVKIFEKTKNVGTFLDNVTFNDDIAGFFVHDFKEVDIIDDFDEEVIPNSYDDACDFRRKHPRSCLKRKRIQ